MRVDAVLLTSEEIAIVNELLSGYVDVCVSSIEYGRCRFSLPLVQAIGRAGGRVRVMKRYLYWAFDHCSTLERCEVIKSIGLIGDRDQNSVSRVLCGFESRSVDLQASSAHALGNLRFVPESLQEAILKGIESASPDLRGSCLHACNRAIPIIAVPLRLVENTIFDQDPWVRCASLKSVELSKIVSSRICNGIIAALVDKDGLVFRAAIDTLNSLGPAGAFAKPVLEEILHGGNAQALEPLWRITGGITQYRHLFPRLLAYSKDEFCDAIYHIGKDGAVALPTLIDALADSEWDTCLSAVDTIASFGLLSESAIPALKALFDHESSVISHSAREAVKAIDADSRRP